jgi:hypothetical protein
LKFFSDHPLRRQSSSSRSPSHQLSTNEVASAFPCISCIRWYFGPWTLDLGLPPPRQSSAVQAQSNLQSNQKIRPVKPGQTWSSLTYFPMQSRLDCRGFNRIGLASFIPTGQPGAIARCRWSLIASTGRSAGILPARSNGSSPFKEAGREEHLINTQVEYPRSETTAISRLRSGQPQGHFF